VGLTSDPARADDLPHGSRWWIVLAVGSLIGGLAAVVAEAAVWIQAVPISTSLAAAAVLLHRRDHVRSVGELERPRPETVVDIERRAITLFERHPVPRRSLLGAGAAGLVGAASLLRWLGPRPARGTAWETGRRLVTTEGEPLRPRDVAVGGVVTAWPEGAVDVELSAAMVIRLRERPRPPTRAEYVVDDTVLAYSRICTHAGCPVALFRDRDQALFCPCHQATFDAAAGAVPTFGPASRPLPQLPLGVDDAGFLVALGDFDTMPGPPGGGP
jgi:ubiquinol-cytochrome c reductase iron-sulfur subunit